MKLLTTEMQAELQAILSELAVSADVSVTMQANLKYWSIELKPKRVRKKKAEIILDTHVEV